MLGIVREKPQRASQRAEVVEEISVLTTSKSLARGKDQASLSLLSK